MRIYLSVLLAFSFSVSFSTVTYANSPWVNRVPSWLNNKAAYPRPVYKILFGRDKIDYATGLGYRHWVVKMGDKPKARFIQEDKWKFVVVNGFKCTNAVDGHRNVNCFFSFSYKGPYQSITNVIKARYFMQCYLVVGPKRGEADNVYVNVECPTSLQ